MKSSEELCGAGNTSLPGMKLSMLAALPVSPFGVELVPSADGELAGMAGLAGVESGELAAAEEFAPERAGAEEPAVVEELVVPEFAGAEDPAIVEELVAPEFATAEEPAVVEELVTPEFATAEEPAEFTGGVALDVPPPELLVTALSLPVCAVWA